MLLFCLGSSAIVGWYNTPNQPEGFYFYDPLQPKPADPKEAEKSAMSPSTPSYAQRVEAIEKQLKELLSRAILDPTPQNLYQYQIAQQALFERSSLFGQRWMQNIYLSPKLDQTLKTPVNQVALQIYSDQRQQQREQTIRSLSKDYSLFFFFSSDCVYCHKMAPIIQRFSEQYRWKVLPISLDGKPIPEYPTAKPDNGLSEQWKVDSIPALFAVNPRTKHAFPVAYGLTSLDEIENRIQTLVGEYRA